MLTYNHKQYCRNLQHHSITGNCKMCQVPQEDEEIDEDIVDIGEENLDRMASHCAEKDWRSDSSVSELCRCPLCHENSRPIGAL